MYRELYFRAVFISLFTLVLIVLTGTGLTLKNNIEQKNNLKKAEKEIRKSEERLSTTMDSPA